MLPLKPGKRYIAQNTDTGEREEITLDDEGYSETLELFFNIDSGNAPPTNWRVIEPANTKHEEMMKNLAAMTKRIEAC